mgnify:CR=1 FL=1
MVSPYRTSGCKSLAADFHAGKSLIGFQHFELLAESFLGGNQGGFGEEQFVFDVGAFGVTFKRLDGTFRRGANGELETLDMVTNLAQMARLYREYESEGGAKHDDNTI